MRLLIGVIICCLIQSCSLSMDNPEVWKSTYLLMTDDNGKVVIDRYNNHSQYLYLYKNGKASIVDSLANGKTTHLESNWEMIEKDGRTLFVLGHEKNRVRGIAYPIILKDESNFEMSLELSEGKVIHIWNLIRVNKGE